MIKVVMLRYIGVVLTIGLLAACGHRESAAERQRDANTVAGKTGKVAYSVAKESGKIAKEAEKKLGEAAHQAHEGWKEAAAEDRKH
jgi:hypothetical protein